MRDFEKHKQTFDKFLNKLKENEKIGVLSHANCIDGMASAVFFSEILKKKAPTVKTDLHFIAYGNGILDKFDAVFSKQGIEKVFVLDFNADIDMFDEFDRFRNKFDVCFIDHHPMHAKLRQDQVIKTHKDDCTALVMYQLGEDIIDYNKWSWLVSVASVSEFSWHTPENLTFIQSYYPNYKPGDENSDLLKLVHKMGSLVTYYSQDSLKAYDLIYKNDFKKIDEIHHEVWSEMERCLQDFDKNAEHHFDKKLYFYFFKSKFSLGSKMGTILSLKYKGATIVVISEMEGTNMYKVSVRNNADKLPFLMSDMLGYGVKGLENAMGAGHPNASGGSFMKKDIDTFKKNIIEFVKNKLPK